LKKALPNLQQNDERWAANYGDNFSTDHPQPCTQQTRRPWLTPLRVSWWTIKSSRSKWERLGGAGLGAAAIHAELGEVIAGFKPARETPEQVTIFESVGVAFQDTAAGWLAYSSARKRQLGRWSKSAELTPPGIFSLDPGLFERRFCRTDKTIPSGRPSRRVALPAL
jgi:hypothetical protein